MSETVPPAFASLADVRPQLDEETSKHIGQLVNTLLTPVQAGRFERVKVYLLVLLLFLLWGGYLVVFTIGHYNQTTTISVLDTTYTYYLTHVHWFQPVDGMFITLPFLLPGLALLTSVFILVMQERYRRQVPALMAALRAKEDGLAPISAINWPPLTETNGQYRPIAMGGWQTSGRTYLFVRLGSRLMLLLFVSAQALIRTATLLGDGTERNLSDIVTSIVFILVLVFIFVAELRLIRHPSVATVDALGITLPSPTTQRNPVRLGWGEIRALYIVQTRDAYWLLMTNDALYGWVQSPLSGGLGGTELAKAIVGHTQLLVRDATDLCVAAVGKTPTNAALAARWGELFAQTPAPAKRRSLRFDLRVAFVLLAVGLVLGIAASWVISQFA